jgi:RNA polymerase sigma factor (sigma-70 family)
VHIHKPSFDGEAVPQNQFVEVWTLHERAVYDGCLRWLDGRRDEADEAYARSAIQAFLKFPSQFHDVGHAKAWLLRVARNVCMDVHRERQRHREVVFEGDFGPRAQARIEQVADRTGDPETAFLSREQDRHVRNALARLPRRLRRTAELHFLADMRSCDIALELGISPPNVRKRIQHARDLLRDALNAMVPHEPAERRTEETPGRAERTLCCRHLHSADGNERDVEVAVEMRVERRDARRFGALERYIERHPRGWRKRLELARTLVIEGRWTEALAHYRQVVEIHPFAEAPWRELGEVLRALDRRVESSNTFERAALMTGRDVQRLYFQAMAAASAGSPARAEELLATAVEAGPAHVPSLRALGAAHLDAGCPLQALDLLQRCLELDPEEPLAPSLCHDALAAAGQFLAARKLIEQAALRDPSNALALERVIAARARAGLIDGEEGRRSDELLARLQRLAPDRTGTVVAAARLSFARGHKNARYSLLAHLRRHPRDVASWLALGRLLLADGDVQASIGALRRARELAPPRRDVVIALCRTLRCMPPAEEAHRTLAVIRTRWAEDAVLLTEGALLAVTLEDVELGLQLLRSAVTLEPRLPRLRRHHAALLMRAGHFEEARLELLAAAELVPPDDAHAEAIAVALTRAHLHCALGAAAEAREAWMEAWERTGPLGESDPALAQARQGEILERMGMLREASAAYRSALAHAIAFPLRRDVVAALQRLSGVSADEL